MVQLIATLHVYARNGKQVDSGTINEEAPEKIRGDNDLF